MLPERPAAEQPSTDRTAPERTVEARIFEELSLLYELSLSVGASLDLRTCCASFLRVLTARKNLGYAAVWLTADALGLPGDGLHLAHALPTAQVRATETDAGHPMARVSAPVSFLAGDPDADPVPLEHGTTAGAYLLFPLADVGMLRLYDAHRTEPFDAKYHRQLRDVVAKFAVSIQGCLAHGRLARETEERRRAEEDARLAFTRLAALLQWSPSGVLLVDEQRRVKLVNETFCALFPSLGSPADLIGVHGAVVAQRLRDLFADPEALETDLEATVDALEARTGDELALADGRIVERDFVPIYVDGAHRGHLWQYRDVTERSQTQQAIDRLREFYQQVLEALPSHLAVFDADARYRFLTANTVPDPAKRAALTGKTDAEYDRLHGRERAVSRVRMDTIARIVLTRAAERFEEALPDGRGGLRTFDRFMSPILDEAGRVTHVVAHGIDITTRRQAEQARENFLANMSHEMRTPLNAVIGTAELMRRTALDDDQRGLLTSLQYAAETLLALINDALDLAKLEAGGMTFEAVPFVVRDVLDGATRMLQARAHDKGLALSLDVDPSLPAVLIGDSVRLNQILLNLVSNAVKFTESGAVQVRARGLGIGPDRVEVTLEVADTGIGIPEDKCAVIFERFVQASSDTTRKYGGTGLGLAITREIVDGLGGALDVASTEGQGSTFRVRVPFGIGAEMADAPAFEPADLAGVRVLLVDDMPMNRYVARRMLESWGALVSVAENGQEAVDAVLDAPAVPFDIVLMDIHMPVMDGLEATRRIRSRVSSHVLPIVALTASVLPEHRPRMLDAGMDDVVFKPFRPEMLQRTIATHVESARQIVPPFAPLDVLAPDGAATGPPAEGLTANDVPANGLPTNGVLADDPAAGQAPSESTGTVNLARLRSDWEGDEAFVSYLLSMFAEQTPETVAQLRGAYAAGDLAAVGEWAHRLKGGAGIVGAAAMMEACGAIEAAVRGGRASEIGPLLDLVGQETDRAYAEIASFQGAR